MQRSEFESHKGQFLFSFLLVITGIYPHVSLARPVASTGTVKHGGTSLGDQYQYGVYTRMGARVVYLPPRSWTQML